MQLIKECTVRGDRLDVTTDPAFRERYLWDDFFIEYSDDIGLDRMDPTVPLAPYILNVAPLVWLSGETYEIDALDADLAQALEEIRQVIKRNIPGRAWDGQLKPARLVTNEANTTSGDERISLLFTAGVDSVYSSLSHHRRLQNLITVWGNETALDFEDRWRLLSRQCERFAEQFGHRNFLIKTNAKEIIKRKRIAPDIRVWWHDVQLGMGMLGLCIPPVFHWGGKEILISSTYPGGGYHGVAGSSPEIDDRVRCAGISGVHVAFDETRQEKLNYVVRKCREEHLPVPQLRVCNRPYVDVLNRCDCEKCLRTMTGIIVAGGTPTKFGFPISPAEVSRRVQARYRATPRSIDETLEDDWLSMQPSARRMLENGGAGDAPESVRELLVWLGTLDIPDYIKRFKHRNRWTERAKKTLSLSPWLFETVKNTIERRSWFGY